MTDAEILEQWVDAGFKYVTLEQALKFEKNIYNFIEELVDEDEDETGCV